MPTATQAQIVFTEIPASDPQRACAFYEALLEGKLVEDNAGPNPVWMFPHAEGGAAPGHVYPGKPAKDGEGITAHFAVTGDLADAMQRVKKGGGQIVSDVIEIYVGAFFYARDSEGNSLGVFKYKGLMRRADRLFQIVQYLRGGRLVTARALAERLEVSDRTIYRDIADLQSTGVPIDGEAGVGYVMRSGYDLPPLMFTRDEIVALVAGIRMVKSWGGIGMARAAAEALVKIELVLPEAERQRAAGATVFAPPMELTDEVRELIDLVERAIEARDILRFGYEDRQGAVTDRRVHPLGLWFWGKVWTLVAWCETREDFRMFRLDRTTGLAVSGERFKPDPARSLAECLRQYEARYGPQR